MRLLIKKIEDITLRLNVWFSVKQPTTQLTKEFPYQALNPVTQKQEVITGKEHIYDILMHCHAEATEKGYDVGEALYQQHFFFADTVQLYDVDCQNLIKKYIFCDTFKCPPYPSLQETPAELIDNFLLIKREIQKASVKDK